MKERPILFQTEMVEAILNDWKNETRRLTGLERVNENPDAFTFAGEVVQTCRFWDADNESDPNPQKTEFVFLSIDGHRNLIKSPYGWEGDSLWVREAFCTPQNDGNVIYKAGYKDHPLTWEPGIHMPREAARLVLFIDSIKPQRIQEITDFQASREGIKLYYESAVDRMVRFNYLNPTDYSLRTALESFRTLWIHINGEESWNKNPWVWAISFHKELI